MTSQLVYASSVALTISNQLCGVLLMGPSGAGKSDLALRMIDAGAKLISDDQTLVAFEKGNLALFAPELISGKLEVRGVGILELPFVENIKPALVVGLVTPEEVARLPRQKTFTLFDQELPYIELNAFEASTLAKIRFAICGTWMPIDE